MFRKSTVFALATAVVIVTALQIILPYSGMGKGIQNILFVGPFLGLAWINILLFALPMCIGLGSMIKNGFKENTQKQDEKNLRSFCRVIVLVKAKCLLGPELELLFVSV